MGQIKLNNLDDIVEFLINMYYQYYPSMEIVPVNVVFTECLSKTHLDLRPDIKDVLINQHIELNDNDNGRMVTPIEVQQKIHILLNTKKVLEYTKDKSMTWVGTIAHELTHAIDYYQMARKESLTFYDPLNKVQQYYAFQLWSEYHARKYGYRFLRIFLAVDVERHAEEERINHILNIEWPMQLKLYEKGIHTTLDNYRRMYLTMQLLGRFSVWCDLFPHKFNEDLLSGILAPKIELKPIYLFLRNHETFDSVYRHFHSFENILIKI